MNHGRMFAMLIGGTLAALALLAWFLRSLSCGV